MNIDAFVIETEKYLKDLFAGESTGHDFEHTHRVYLTSLKLLENHPEADKDIVIIGALLHDVDDPKLFNTQNNQNARNYLAKFDFDAEFVEKIIGVINEVSFSKNKDKKPSSIEAMIVQDADRLDAIGAIGIARAFAYGGKNNRPLLSTLNHFDEKLLLIKDMLNLEGAKEMAESRHHFMQEYLEELNKEISE